MKHGEVIAKSERTSTRCTDIFSGGGASRAPFEKRFGVAAKDETEHLIQCMADDRVIQIDATNLSRNSTKNRYQESKAIARASACHAKPGADVTLTRREMTGSAGPPCRRSQKLASKMTGCNLAGIKSPIDCGSEPATAIGPIARLAEVQKHIDPVASRSARFDRSPSQEMVSQLR